MTHPFGELSAQRKRLGAALRRLRTDAGLSAQQLAELAGLSQSRVSRIERGEQSVKAETVQRWAEATGATGTVLAGVMELAESAATQAVSWRKAVTKGLVKLQQDSRDAEAAARVILNFQPLGIPGLLQIPEYARRVLALGYPQRAAAEVGAAVAVRMDRRVILYDESRRFEFVMTSAALRWLPIPPALMRAQLAQVSTISTLPNVTVGVIPFGADVPAWCDHSFNILDDRGDAGDAVVHVETLTSALTIADPDDIAAYRDVFAKLRAAAVTGDAARQLIAAAEAELGEAGLSPATRLLLRGRTAARAARQRPAPQG